MLESWIRLLVRSKLAFAVRMNDVLESRIVCRAVAVPPKAVPSSLMVVVSDWVSTEPTVVAASPSSFSVGSGVRVRDAAISEPSWR